MSPLLARRSGMVGGCEADSSGHHRHLPGAEGATPRTLCVESALVKRGAGRSWLAGKTYDVAVSRLSIWLPAVLWMALVLWFSSGDFGAENTGSLLKPLLLSLLPWLTPSQ